MASVKQDDEKKFDGESKPESKPMAAEDAESTGPVPERRPEKALPKASVEARAAGPGFFTIYKKGQGYWTRMGTVGGAALVAILTLVFVHDQVRAYQSERTALIADAVFLIAYSLVVFRIINKPNVVEFLIATDSEMKKVNWTTKAELIGSTKVVILFMFLIMILLFIFDTAFGYFFEFIRVLQFGPFG